MAKTHLPSSRTASAELKQSLVRGEKDLDILEDHTAVSRWHSP